MGPEQPQKWLIKTKCIALSEAFCVLITLLLYFEVTFILQGTLYLLKCLQVVGVCVLCPIHACRIYESHKKTLLTCFMDDATNQ